jgi:hypothetical protein
MRGFPSLLHRWDVCRRDGHILRLPNTRYLPEDVRQLFTCSDQNQFAHAIASTSCMQADTLMQRDSVQMVFDDGDVERTLYRKFLLESNFSLKTVADGAEWREEKDPEKRHAKFVDQHYDTPGETEKRIMYRRRHFPFFVNSKNFKTMRYPDDVLTSMRRIGRVKRAQHKRTLRANQENLTDAEIERLKAVIIAAHAAEGPEAGETDLQREARLAHNQEEATTCEDLLQYLHYCLRQNPAGFTGAEQKRYDELKDKYGKMDWVLEYIVLEVMEDEKRELKRKQEVVRRYQVQTRSDFHPVRDAAPKAVPEEQEEDDSSEALAPPRLTPAAAEFKKPSAKVKRAADEAFSNLAAIVSDAAATKKSLLLAKSDSGTITPPPSSTAVLVAPGGKRLRPTAVEQILVQQQPQLKRTSSEDSYGTPAEEEQQQDEDDTPLLPPRLHTSSGPTISKTKRRIRHDRTTSFDSVSAAQRSNATAFAMSVSADGTGVDAF